MKIEKLNENHKIFLGIGLIAAVFLIIASFNAGIIYNRNISLNFSLEKYSFHVTTYIQRVGDPEPIFWSYHAGVETTIGKNWVEDQLGDSPSTDPAKWISLSTYAGTPNATMTQLDNEIAVGGLERVAGTYSSNGNGAWKITHQFAASTTHTNVQLVGVHWASSGNNNLFFADTITPITLNNGDKLTIEASISH